MEGLSHTVEVTASSLYEAVSQGIATIRGKEWVDGFPQRTGVVKVSVADVRVEHEVKMADFERWLERPSRSPRETIDRQRIRAILGMAFSRDRE